MGTNHFKQICSECPKEGLQDPLHKTTPSIQELCRLSIPDFQKGGKCNIKRSGHLITGEGHRRMSKQSTRLFQFNLHRREEGLKQVKTRDKPKASQQKVYPRFNFQNAFSVQHKKSYFTRRFLHKDRLKKRFLSHKSLQTSQKICQFRLEEEMLPISPFALRAINITKDIHSNDKTIHSSPSFDRSTMRHVFGRPSDPDKVKEICKESSQVGSWSPKKSGIHCEQGQVCPQTFPNSNLPGASVGFCPNVSEHYDRQITKSPNSGFQPNPEQPSILQTDHAILGHSKLCSKRTQANPCSGKNSPKGTSRSISLSQRLVQNIPSFRLCPKSVRKTHTIKHGSSIYSPNGSRCSSSYRRNSGRIWSSLAGIRFKTPVYTRFLAPKSVTLPHKLERTKDSPTCSTGMDPLTSKQGNFLTTGQHYCIGLSEKSGGGQINGPLQIGMQHSSFYREEQYNHDSLVYTYSSQCRSGLPIPSQANPRLVSSKVNHKQDIFSISETSSGPLRIKEISSTSTLLLPNPRQSGHRERRICSEVGIQCNVLFSPSTSSSSDHSQIPQHSRTSQSCQTEDSITHSPLLGIGGMAPSDTSPLIFHAQENQVQEVYVDRQQFSDLSQGCEGLKTNPVALQRHILSTMGFTPEAITSVEKSITESSLKTYKQCWKVWLAYCERTNVVATTISVTVLSSFLQDLFRKGDSWSSIGVARSAISFFLQPHLDPTVGAHPIISKQMKSFFKRRPPKKKFFPPWNVAKLINLISSKGWYPAVTINLQNLAIKLAVLLALSTAKRCSDLSLLSMEQGHLYMDSDRIMFIPLFGSKTDRPNNFMSQFSIYRNKKDPHLCPVLYLKQYLKRTKKFRTAQNKMKLFLSNNKFHMPVCAKTINGWIRKAIKLAGAEMSPGSTRNIAATAAVAAGVPLNTILEAGNWASTRTPVRHYFHELVTKQDEARDALQRAVLALAD